MSLSAALSTAVSGLTAAQTRAQTTASNIANANTDGYVRRTVALTERVVGGQGNGVMVAGIERQESTYLTAERMRLEANLGFASERARGAEAISTLLGAPGATDGLFGAYTRFETALRDAAATPESGVLQRQVLQTARDITNSFQSLNAQTEQIRARADGDIADAVATVNTALQRLEEINTVGGGAITPDVLDEQQRLIDQVNDFIPVTVFRDNGAAYLTTDSGFSLLTTNAVTIDFQPGGSFQSDRTLGNGLSGLSVNGIDITPGSGASQEIRGGRIAALFDVRDRQATDFMDGLDALATDLISRFSDDSVDPTKPLGAEGLFTAGTGTPPAPGDRGVADLISINAAFDPDQGGEIFRLRDGIGAVTEGPAGNGDQLDRLINAFTSSQSTPAALGGGGAQNASGMAALLASDVNYEFQRLAEEQVYSGARFDAAADAELGATAVDTDQELQDLLIIEQSYAANARVIQTISDLIDQLISIGT